jgi:hypothetical protein
LNDAVNSFVGSIPLVGEMLVEILSWAKAVLSYPLGVIADLLESVTFLGQLKAALGTVGAFIMAASSLQPWTVTFQAVPQYSHYSIRNETLTTGAFELEVQAGADPLAVVRPCADLAGIDLPAADTPDGAAVQFSLGNGFGNHFVETSRDILVSGGVASLEYEVNEETSSDHANGEETIDAVTVSAHVDRPTVLALTQLQSTIFGEGVLLGFIESLLGPLIADAQDALQDLLGLSIGWRTAYAGVTRHKTPSATFEVIWRPEYLNPYRTWTWTGVTCSAPDGPWMVTITVDGRGILAGAYGTTSAEFVIDLGTGELLASVPVTGLPGGGISTYAYRADVAAGPDLLTFVVEETVEGSVTGVANVGDAAIVYGPSC